MRKNQHIDVWDLQVIDDQPIRINKNNTNNNKQSNHSISSINKNSHKQQQHPTSIINSKSINNIITTSNNNI